MVRIGRPPRITHLSWGRIEGRRRAHLQGCEALAGRGARVGLGRDRPTTGPGFSLPMSRNSWSTAEVVVLCKDILRALQVCPETLELLKSKGIPAHVLQTEAAVRLYNELAEKQRVAGLFHSTC
jgi:Protein of unknown function (DUF498/DUF598)